MFDHLFSTELYSGERTVKFVHFTNLRAVCRTVSGRINISRRKKLVWRLRFCKGSVIETPKVIMAVQERLVFTDPMSNSCELTR
jgi:hypothetical protein